MNHGGQPRAQEAGPPLLAAKLRAGLAQLAEAYDYAHDAHQDVWQFAVEMRSLLAFGLTASDLRWMVSKGYARHARDVTEPHDAARRFGWQQNLSFTAETCFVLSNVGAALCNGLRRGPGAVSSPTLAVAVQSPPDPASAAAGRPQWDPQRRVLRMGDQLVKCFRLTAPNQEAVLTAFEDAGWPQRIANPLSEQPGQDSQNRLHDTIKGLNQHQTVRLLKFLGDGTGQGVLWDLVQGDAIAQLPASRPWRAAA